MKTIMFIRGARRAALEYLPYETGHNLLVKLVKAIIKGSYANVAVVSPHLSDGEVITMLQNGIDAKYWYQKAETGILNPNPAEKREALRSITSGDLIVTDDGSMFLNLSIVVPTGTKSWVVHRSMLQSAELVE